MYARELSKDRVREALLKAFDLTAALEEFVDYRPIKHNVIGIQKMINRKRNKYRELGTKTAKMLQIARDWNATKPEVFLYDGTLRQLITHKRLTLPS